jgi:hypothetical protein
MTDERTGGAALIVGTVAGIITMSLHPTGHDLFSAGAKFAWVASLTAGVHALALASLPLLFLGALALSIHLNSSNRLSIAALVIYGLGLVALVNAATFSGLVAPGLARRILAEPAPSEDWRTLFNYTGSLNQAFAKVFVVAASAAIVLWSIAMLKTRRLGVGVAIYGCILGPVIILALFLGYLSLGVHGFGMVVLTQGIWFVATGAAMWRVNGTSSAERIRS